MDLVGKKNTDIDGSPIALLKNQRSHILFILSNALQGQEATFLNWYNGHYLQTISKIDGVLTVEHFEQHEIDVTQGIFQPLPYHYLGKVELSLDGAQEARDLIQKITELHQTEPSASDSTTWLYYPVVEKVGRAPKITNPMMMLAFANAIPGTELEFREWYCTRHIRHALSAPTIANGQCIELAGFQQPGVLAADYQIIAIYELDGTPEEVISDFKALPKGAFDFPSLDLSRFAEWVYRPLSEACQILNQY